MVGGRPRHSPDGWSDKMLWGVGVNQRSAGVVVRAADASKAFGCRLAVAGRRFASLLACLTLVAAAGCATPAPTASVELSVVPTADLNPDASGRPSPVVLRVYRLASDSAFRA